MMNSEKSRFEALVGPQNKSKQRSKPMDDSFDAEIAGC